MMPAKRGLIVEVTENDIIGGGANPMAHAVKTAQKVLPLQWATELAAHGITVLAITPGFLYGPDSSVESASRRVRPQTGRPS